MNASHPPMSGKVETPVRMSAEPYISPDYARDERDLLWGKVWQIACREEEIPKPGDFYTYDIQERSIIVVRTATGEIRAFHNACPHRGRRLTRGCGRARHFYCAYHGWKWQLDGVNTFVQDREDWGGSLTDEDAALGAVKVGTWGGFVFVNPDPDCEPLEAYLQTIPYWMDPFEIGKMRYRWRKRTRYPANWKVVTEAFIEGYHSAATHPQLVSDGYGRTVSCPEGLHARMIVVGMEGGGIGTSFDVAEGVDIRSVPYETVKALWETQWCNTTETFIEAARRLPDMLPADVDMAALGQAWFAEARRIYAENGVEWPEIDPQHMRDVGINWHLFPNAVLLPNVTYLLGFRILPDGLDPDSCIMEVYTLERFGEGKEPQTAWEEPADLSAEHWPLLLRQDFRNMGDIQVGMKSLGARGLKPTPVQEASVINMHRNLARYMGRCEPQPLAATGAR